LLLCCLLGSCGRCGSLLRLLVCLRGTHALHAALLHALLRKQLPLDIRGQGSQELWIQPQLRCF
jgi:hypothetical protein